MAQEIKLKKNIVEIDIDKITPYEGSHKTDANINLLIESIKDFGVNQPITVDKNYVVVTGNGVYKAAKEAGVKTLPCIILDDLTDEQIRQYRIADDKTQEFATWNEKKLRQELSYLQDPTSMQMYFDESIVGMLGLDAKIKQGPIVSQQQTETAGIVNAMTKAEKDKKFKEELNNVNASMNIQPAEYFEYHCSKCGRLVKVKVN